MPSHVAEASDKRVPPLRTTRPYTPFCFSLSTPSLLSAIAATLSILTSIGLRPAARSGMVARRRCVRRQSVEQAFYRARSRLISRRFSEHFKRLFRGCRFGVSPALGGARVLRAARVSGIACRGRMECWRGTAPTAVTKRRTRLWANLPASSSARPCRCTPPSSRPKHGGVEARGTACFRLCKVGCKCWEKPKNSCAPSSSFTATARFPRRWGVKVEWSYWGDEPFSRRS